MIKVAHITTVPMSLRYGLLNQLLYLQEAGYEVCGISAPGADAHVVESSGIRHFGVPLTRSITPATDVFSLWHLYRVMRRERFTIVHTHNPKPGLLGQLAARLAGVPIVVNTVHGFYFHEHMKPSWRSFYVNVEKVAARCSHSILSQNREDIQTAIAEGISRRDQIHYLGNGIDTQRFRRETLNPDKQAALRQELNLPSGCTVVGFVGRLVEEKGLLELLQAAQIVRRQALDVRFLIIGPIEPDKDDGLTPDIAADYGLADICVFTGRRLDMPELFGLMDVFVLPSHREGFPRSPMEASAMGVPSIVTDIRGCREAVEDGQNGLLVPLRDVEGLAQAILDLLSSLERRQAMGQIARQIAEERFDERIVFAKIKTEYARLLRKRGITPPASASSQKEMAFSQV